jgi:hypothetical protein
MTSRVPLGPLFAIGFLSGGLALYVGDLASFTSRIDPVMQAFLIMLGVIVAIGSHRRDWFHTGRRTELAQNG